MPRYTANHISLRQMRMQGYNNKSNKKESYMQKSKVLTLFNLGDYQIVVYLGYLLNFYSNIFARYEKII